MTEISTTDFIFMIQTYEYRGKTYYDGNMYNVPSPIARRLVARGIASYTEPKEKPVIKPVLKPVVLKSYYKEIKPQLLEKLNLPKIGFLTYQDIWDRGGVASTRMRVTYAVKYMQNAIVSNNPEDFFKCDVIVFQTRFEKADVILAKRLKSEGKIIIFDETDPHWDKNYCGARPELNEMIKLADLITVPTHILRLNFREHYSDKVVMVVPDRMDLEIHKDIKEHTEKDEYVILWHGSYGNICSIDLAREDLEKLGKEFKLKLLCIYDNCNSYKIKPFKNLKVESREWSNQKVIDGILEADVSINPKFRNWKSYKSNNKTIKSWALGVSCVEYNFYRELKELLSSVNLRIHEGQRLRKMVERKYDSRQTAKEWESIAKILFFQKKYEKPEVKKNAKMI